jgi:tRNA 2-thiouridine synthesizing protein D
MKFAIALFAAPQLPASRRALRFAQAAVAGGHQIVRLFFYQDGVYNASTSAVTPQDEADLSVQWTAFIKDNHLDAVVCISAALRRGLLDQTEAERYGRNAVNVDPPWTLSGLGQLHEAIQDADRLICFGGH